MQSATVKVGDLVKANCHPASSGLGLVVSTHEVLDNPVRDGVAHWFRVNWFHRPHNSTFGSFDKYYREELILISSAH